VLYSLTLSCLQEHTPYPAVFAYSRNEAFHVIKKNSRHIFILQTRFQKIKKKASNMSGFGVMTTLKINHFLCSVNIVVCLNQQLMQNFWI
jgi:hypothetical protein